jgi:hypothetical protein
MFNNTLLLYCFFDFEHVFAADFWRINNNVVVILATFYINFKENSIELKLSILLIIRLVIGIFVGAMSLICFIAPANVLTLTYS